MRIERIAIMRISAGKIISVFAHIERAEQHRAGSLHPRDERRILPCRRMIAIDLGAGARDQAIHLKQILDREGNAGTRRQRLALRARCINGFGVEIVFILLVLIQIVFIVLVAVRRGVSKVGGLEGALGFDFGEGMGDIFDGVPDFAGDEDGGGGVGGRTAWAG